MHSVVLSIGQEISLVLPSLHALSGCDSTSAFSGMGKQKWVSLLDANPEITAGLTQFGTHASDIVNEAQAACRSLVSLAYSGNIYDSLNDLRYELFCKKNLSSEKLPPTEDAFVLHLKRANYQAYIWIHALQPLLRLPSLIGNGWKRDESGGVVPHQMTRPAAPEAFLVFVKCGCQTGCYTLRCKCHKESMLCSDACGCENDSCANRVPDEPSEADDSEDDSDS
jgi:hypothetical protein